MLKPFYIHALVWAVRLYKKIAYNSIKSCNLILVRPKSLLIWISYVH